MNITPTKKELAGLPPLRATEDIPPEKKIAHVKFFGGGRGTWYAVEGSREGDDLMFYGYVVSPLGPDCDEWGYFSLNELQAVQYPLKVNGRVAGHVGLERDKWWKPGPVPLHCVGCDETHPLVSTHPTTNDPLCAGCGEAVRMPGGNMAGDDAAAALAFERAKAAPPAGPTTFGELVGALKAAGIGVQVDPDAQPVLDAEDARMGRALRAEAAREERQALSDAELDEVERNEGQLGLSFGIGEGGES